MKGISFNEEDSLTNSSTSSQGSFHDQQDCDDLLDSEDFKEYLVSIEVQHTAITTRVTKKCTMYTVWLFTQV